MRNSECHSGQTLIIAGQDAVTSEAAREVRILTSDTSTSTTTIALHEPLKRKYKRETTLVYANVALATHGETVHEVLGGGDPGQPFQQFTLKQPPLTYVSDDTPNGTRSTLEVRVNDIQWHEVTSLYGRGPNDRVYTVRLEDDGTVQLEFGLSAARLPAGHDNVRATYRKGIGLAGLVKAGQLSLLMTRPLGVKEVVNLLDADGADDPEKLDDARRNAPLTVLTLDRIVSLQDYQAFARAFAGIAKALATWTRDGRTRGVLVTVVGPKGQAVTPKSPVYENLLTAMRRASHSLVPLRVVSYASVLFRLEARVKVDPDSKTDLVLAQVRQVLRDRLSFEARDLGQPVVLSEVIALMQGVAGVVAVVVDAFYRADQPRSREARLLARQPVGGLNESVLAAELLTLDPVSFDLVQVLS